MADRIEAVIFDWGGTLTPWKTIDPAEEWATLARAAVPDRHEEAAAQLMAAATTVWTRSRDEHTSATLEEICTLAGVPFDDAHFADYQAFWEHATVTDDDVVPLFSRLKVDGLKVGVLSNTVWPRAWHEDYFRRDGVLDMLDGAVYTSEIPWTKPAPEAFHAAVQAVGVSDPSACVFVGDRLFDDIWGAANVGMRTIHVPHSDIPRVQVGHTEGEPDAVAVRLAHVYDIVAAWRDQGTSV
ncbi:MAG: HAD family hydrolase [Nocardioidaceae bacterium]